MAHDAHSRWGRFAEVVEGRGRTVSCAGDLGGTVAFTVRVDRGGAHGECRVGPVGQADAFPGIGEWPVSRLLRALRSTPGPAGSRAASRLAELLAPAESIAFLDGLPWEWGARDLRAYHAADRAGRRALRAARSAPALARVLPALRRGMGRDGVLDALVPFGPRDPAHEGRALHVAWAPDAPTLRALLDMPLDWFPGDPGERDALSRVAAAALPLTLALGGHACLRGARGRWAEYEGRLARAAAPATPPGAVADARDMVQAFADEVAAPILAAAGRLRGRDAPFSPGPALFAAAARTLLGDKGLPSILAASAGWHARPVAGPRGDASGRGAGWPVPFPPLRAPGGLDLVPLADPGALAREGAPTREGGLGTCVASYARACAEGRSALVSVRREGKRLSTAEFDLSGPVPRLVQHKGARNAPPPADAEVAVAWLVAGLSSGRVAVAESYRAHLRAPARRTLDGACGYDWRDPGLRREAVRAWAPFLSRPLRDPQVLASRLVEAWDAARADATEARWTAAQADPPPWWARLLATAGAPIADLARAAGDRAGDSLHASGRPGGRAAARFAEATVVGAAVAAPVCAAVAAGPGPAAGPAALAGWAGAWMACAIVGRAVASSPSQGTLIFTLRAR